MIIGIFPDPRMRLGAGKTLFGTWLVNILREKTGKQICANRRMYGVEYNFLEKYTDLIDLRDSIIWLDDIYMTFLDKSAMITKVVKLFTGTSRHHNNDIVYSSSRYIEYVNKNLRLHTNILTEVSHDKATDILRIKTYDTLMHEIRSIFPAYLPGEIVREVYKRFDTLEDVRIWNI
jgi:hypothetical protein